MFRRAFSRTSAATLLAAAVCSLLSSPVMAQSTAARFPAKPIRLLVPYAAGGGADVVARPVALKLGDALGQPILYENQGSSGGIVAVQNVARAAPDGYTLLLGSGSTQAINPSLFTNLPYESPKGFAPITIIANAPLILTVRGNFPARNLQENIAYAKANPGKINWGSAGSSIGLLGIELMQLKAGIKVQHIPYKGSGPAYAAVLAGEVDMFLVNVGVIAGALKDGRVRAIGNGGTQRLVAIPDIPTFAELGMPGYEVGSWYGLLAPAGTPKPVIDRIAAETIKILKTPDITKLFNEQGAYAVANTPEEMGAVISHELGMWADVVKAAGIKPQPL